MQALQVAGKWMWRMAGRGCSGRLQRMQGAEGPAAAGKLRATASAMGQQRSSSILVIGLSRMCSGQPNRLPLTARKRMQPNRVRASALRFSGVRSRRRRVAGARKSRGERVEIRARLRLDARGLAHQTVIQSVRMQWGAGIIPILLCGAGAVDGSVGGVSGLIGIDVKAVVVVVQNVTVTQDGATGLARPPIHVPADRCLLLLVAIVLHSLGGRHQSVLVAH